MKKIIQNMNWIIGCKIAQSILQLIIGMLTARYLGPSNYGLISYAASITAFVLPIMQLGLRSTLVQEYVENSDREGEILGTGLVMNLISAVACVIAIACFVTAADSASEETVAVCILYSICLLFQALDMVQYWFQARLLSKYPALAMLGAYVVVSAYRLYLLAAGKRVHWFALAYTLEAAVIGIGLIICYFRRGGSRLSCSAARAGKLFAKSKYYMLSGLLVAVFQYADHVMLKWMASDAENGYYTTAAAIAGMTSFLFAAVIDSVRPVILEKKLRSQEEYGQGVSKLYAVVVYAALLQSGLLTLLARPIVTILYGELYAPSIPVLQVLCWHAVFSYMGTVRNIWILAEGRQRLLWVLNLCGALINIGLNALMIPRWGACGAAAASVLTQFFVNFILGFLLRPMRDHNKLLLRGFHPKLLAAFVTERGPQNEKSV